MYPHRVVDLGNLVIPNAGTNSSSLDFTGWRQGVSSISIQGPGVLTGAAKVQVSHDGSTWADKQSGGADITIAADGHVTLQAVDFKYLRIQSDGAEAAERTFIVMGSEGE